MGVIAELEKKASYAMSQSLNVLSSFCLVVRNFGLERKKIQPFLYILTNMADRNCKKLYSFASVKKLKIVEMTSSKIRKDISKKNKKASKIKKISEKKKIRGMGFFP